MLVVVLLAKVGIVGTVVCAAFVTLAVGDEVTLPLQLAAVTTTDIVFPMSACTNV